MSSDQYNIISSTVSRFMEEKKGLEDKCNRIYVHDQEIQALQKETNAANIGMASILNDLKRIEDLLISMELRLYEFEGYFKRIEKERFMGRYRRMIGSIASNFVDTLIEYVFGSPLQRRLKYKLKTVEDIRKADKTQEELARWETYEIYWLQFEGCIDSYEYYLSEFSLSKIDSGCIALNDEASEEPTKVMLEQIFVKYFEMYRQDNREEVLENGKAIIHILDQMSRVLGRNRLLQGM